MQPVTKSYDQLVEHTRRIATLEATSAALEWDERTNMPPGGRAYRAEQVTQLAGMIHEMSTDTQRGEWLDQLIESELADDRYSDSGATIHRLKRDFDQACKLPQKLVEAITHATVVGQQQWEDARAESDFSKFAGALDNIISLKIEAAGLLSGGGDPYDALIDEYEEGAKSEDLSVVFGELRNELVSLIQDVQAAPRQPNVDLLRRNYPIEAQREFGIRAARAIGFDFDCGRLDETTHPFCTSLGPGDTRILTRYDEHWFPGAFFGTLHEAGHGIYDQGLPREQFGLPLGTYVSLGIHESQSRLWENMVGRSRPFWEHFYSDAQSAFPGALSDVDIDAFQFAINAVQPSFIRVEADEVTYNLHIIIRFELEQALISGDLKTPDLPDAWNQKYQEYLGITPTDYANGVLQDVHWSAGLFGYFPTYTLGNLIAAQLLEAAASELGSLDELFARGEFSPLREWLSKNIHSCGRRYEPAELVRRATGDKISATPLIRYLNAKYRKIYGVE